MTTQHILPAPTPSSDSYYDTGDLTKQITTNSPDAQEWFNRGLRWVYGFNHGAASNCFEQALAHDPDCAAAYWGLAYATGPNYNKSWQLFDENDVKRTTERCHWAVEQGLKRGKGSDLEFALLKAIGTRFPFPPEKDTRTPHEWNMAYADAMVDVYKRYKDDIDVAALTADALMSLSPWALWDINTGQPRARTLEAKAIFDAKLNTPEGFNHTGLLHFFIHFIEMSPNPELGLVPGDRLRKLSPDGGHLTHMPSHIDVLVGHYRQAIASNWAAVRADEMYRRISGDQELTTFYRVHDYHTIVYAAMHCGRYSDAIRAVDGMEDSLPHALISVQSPPAADWLEFFLAVRTHVLVRFGKWEEIIATPLPEDQGLYCTVTATTLYAKGLAYAATNRVADAREQQRLYRDALKRVPASRMAFPNTARDVLAVGDPMLEGEIQYRLGHYAEAFESLREAVKRYDNLTYAEPWGYMQPIRHALAGLLLEQDRVEEAAIVYAEDLGYVGTLPRACQHPGNVWALHGYRECLKKLGREGEASIIEKQLAIALAVADVPIKSSCYCVGATKATTSDGVNGVDGSGDCCAINGR